MTFPADPVPPPPPSAPPPFDPPPLPARAISGFWRRLVAFWLDGLIVGVVGLVIGIAFYDALSRMGLWGRLVGFPISLLYFGLGNSASNQGKTVGKRVMGIEVVDAAGNYLSFGRSLIRSLVLSVPFVLNGVFIPADFTPGVIAALVVLAIVVLGGIFSICYLFLFNRRTRQSLHDLAVGSWVVRAGATGPVPPQRVWRGHLVVAAVACVVFAVGTGLMGRLKNSATFGPLLELTSQLQREPHVKTASVMGGTTINYAKGSSHRVTHLSIMVVVDRTPEDFDRAALALARPALADDRLLSGKDWMSVTIVHGFDIFIARWHVSRTITHTPQEWRDLNDSATEPSAKRDSSF